MPRIGTAQRDISKIALIFFRRKRFSETVEEFNNGANNLNSIEPLSLTDTCECLAASGARLKRGGGSRGEGSFTTANAFSAGQRLPDKWLSRDQPPKPKRCKGIWTSVFDPVASNRATGTQPNTVRESGIDRWWILGSSFPKKQPPPCRGFSPPSAAEKTDQVVCPDGRRTAVVWTRSLWSMRATVARTSKYISYHKTSYRKRLYLRCTHLVLLTADR